MAITWRSIISLIVLMVYIADDSGLDGKPLTWQQLRLLSAGRAGTSFRTFCPYKKVLVKKQICMGSTCSPYMTYATQKVCSSINDVVEDELADVVDELYADAMIDEDENDE